MRACVSRLDIDGMELTGMATNLIPMINVRNLSSISIHHSYDRGKYCKHNPCKVNVHTFFITATLSIGSVQFCTQNRTKYNLSNLDFDD